MKDKLRLFLLHSLVQDRILYMFIHYWMKELLDTAIIPRPVNTIDQVAKSQKVWFH